VKCFDTRANPAQKRLPTPTLREYDKRAGVELEKRAAEKGILDSSKSG